MKSADGTVSISAQELSALTARNAALEARLAELTRQLQWFKRQLFGPRSERRFVDGEARQLSLAEAPVSENGTSTPTISVQAHTRTTTKPVSDEAPLRFDDTVPVEVIDVAAPELEGIEDVELISEKVTHRLAQRPGSYVILKYVRRVLKRRDTGTIHCAPAPAGVLERSFADVSFLAAMLVDKFCYHLPLYRQHQRLREAGITVSRHWLTQLTHRTGSLLAPIAAAQLEHIRAGRVIAIDETPIKAGRKAKGKMKTGYFWPVYGDADEVSFVYRPSRAERHVHEILEPTPPEVDRRTLLSDGYAAYERYAQKTGITHAQCWAHTRRLFVEAEAVEPALVATALELIGTLYAHEAEIRTRGLKGENKRLYRLEHAKPVVERFFHWAGTTLNDQGLLPSNPLTRALAYARERRSALEVFLADPEVPLDTNHLERALRPIPMGRKSWLFCWSEIGAEHVATIQSLLVTCKLHGILPYHYLVDVLQRIDQHPAKTIAELTPRLWRQHFAHSPLRSVLYAQGP